MELSGAALYGDPCVECGWDWSRPPATSVEYVRAFPQTLRGVLCDASGLERHPDLSWNVTGYVCHVSDNLRAWAERVAGALAGSGTAVGGYDPDQLAAARGYDQMSLQAASWSLTHSTAGWVPVIGEALARDVVLEHHTRGAQRAGEIARNNAHDAHHHLWDIQRTLAVS